MFSGDHEGKTWDACSCAISAKEDREARGTAGPKAEVRNLAVTTKKLTELNAIPKKSGRHVTCTALTVDLPLALLTCVYKINGFVYLYQCVYAPHPPQDLIKPAVCPNLVDSVRALAYVMLQPPGRPRRGEETAFDVRAYLVRSGDLSINGVPIQVVLCGCRAWLVVDWVCGEIRCTEQVMTSMGLCLRRD